MSHVKYQTTNRIFAFSSTKDDNLILLITATFFIFNWTIFTGIDSFEYVDRDGKERRKEMASWMKSSFIFSKLLLIFVYICFFITILGIIFSVPILIRFTFFDTVFGIILALISMLPLYIAFKVGEKLKGFYIYDLPFKNGWVYYLK